MGWYDRKVRRVRDLSCGDTRIFLELEVRRVECRRCGTVKRERLDFLADNPLYTKRFAYYVGRRCRSATIKDVAAEHEMIDLASARRSGRDGAFWTRRRGSGRLRARVSAPASQQSSAGLRTHCTPLSRAHPDPAVQSLTAYEQCRMWLAADPLGCENYEFAKREQFLPREDRRANAVSRVPSTDRLSGLMRAGAD